MSIALFLSVLWILFWARPTWERFWVAELLLLALFTESFVLMRESALGFYMLLNTAALLQGVFVVGAIVTSLARQFTNAISRLVQT